MVGEVSTAVLELSIKLLSELGGMVGEVSTAVLELSIKLLFELGGGGYQGVSGWG